MKIGVEPVVEVGVRFPDLFQHLHIQTQLVVIEVMQYEEAIT